MDALGALKRKWEGDAASSDSWPVAEYDRAGLSPWDRERPIRPLIVDESHRTTLQVRTLNAELTCPVCLGILRHTMTVMECLHRFCDGCITRALRLGRKECPTCRIKCSTKRNLRSDPAIDGLVRRFYSDVEEFEKKQEEQIRSMTATLMKSAQSHENALRRQAAAAARHKETKPPSPPLTNTSNSSNGGSGGPPPPPPLPSAVRKPRATPPTVKMPLIKPPGTAGNEPSGIRHPVVPYTLASRPKPAETLPDVALELRPLDSSASQLSHPFLRVPHAATLGTLAKLLAQRLGASNIEPSSVNFYLPSADAPLEHHRALGELWTEGSSDHRLFYSLPKY